MFRFWYILKKLTKICVRVFLIKVHLAKCYERIQFIKYCIHFHLFWKKPTSTFFKIPYRIKKKHSIFDIIAKSVSIYFELKGDHIAYSINFVINFKVAFNSKLTFTSERKMCYLNIQVNHFIMIQSKAGWRLLSWPFI